MNHVWAPSVQYELYHFGVKGMKWGVRRSQPYADGSYGRTGAAIQKAEGISAKGTARAYGRSMNKLARLAGESNSKRADYAEKYNNLVTRHHYARDKGNEKRAAKLESKAWKMRAKIEMENANAKVAAKKWAKLGVDAAEKGYNVTLREVTYDSAKARRNVIIARTLLGMYGSIPVAVSNTKKDRNYRQTHGTDFSPYAYNTIRAKVTKPKEGH